MNNVNQFCLASLICLFTPLLGQGQARVLFQLNANSNGEEQLKSLLDEFRGTAEFRIENRILEFKRNCELSEEQCQKLRVAAKGTLKEFVRKEETEKHKQLRRYQEQAGFEFDEDGKIIDDDEEPNRAIRNMGFYIETKPAALVEQESLWSKSIKKVLTDEQEEQLKQYRARQKEFLQKAAVDQFIAKLELALFLSEQQREELRPVVTENFGEILFNALKHIPKNDRRAFVIRGVGLAQNDSKYDELVEGILTADQLDEWKRTIEPEIERIKKLPEW